MKVTEQIDAIEASAVNPFKFLVATRVLACICMLPLLTLVADFTGILMGWVATTAARSDLVQFVLGARNQEPGVSRLSARHLPHGRLRTDHRSDRVLSRSPNQGRHGRGRQISHGSCGLGVAVRHCCGCASGAVYFDFFPVTLMDNEPQLQIRELRKAFGEQKVLDGIDLDLSKGETLTVLGRSGSGKSVLLKLIIGLQKPDSGSIRIGGAEVTGMKADQLDEVRKKIGFLFQYSALYDSLTVEENVAFPLRRHTRMPDHERRDGFGSCCHWWAWKRPRRRCPRTFRAA